MLNLFKKRLNYDLFSAEVIRDPYPFYAELRKHSPVHYFKKNKVWAVTCYEDVQYVLKTPAIFSSAGVASIENTLAGNDPPEQSKIRKAVVSYFSPRRIALLEYSIRNITQRLVDNIAAKDSFELFTDLASPLPFLVVSDILGIDEKLIPTYRAWSNAATYPCRLPADTGEISQREKHMADFRAFFLEQVRRCQDSPGDDILSHLVSGRHVKDGLSKNQIADIGMLILIAGNETTINLIGNTMYNLLRNEDKTAVIQNNPEIIPDLIEESLRFDPPTQYVERKTTARTRLSNTKIPANARILAFIASANRDEYHYPDPDRFFSGNNHGDHLSFGFGPHFCIGSQIARLEARIALESLFSRFSNMKLLYPFDEPERNDSLQIRGLGRLDIAL